MQYEACQYKHPKKAQVIFFFCFEIIQYISSQLIGYSYNMGAPPLFSLWLHLTWEERSKQLAKKNV
jgi:hypothetical protein